MKETRPFRALGTEVRGGRLPSLTRVSSTGRTLRSLCLPPIGRLGIGRPGMTLEAGFVIGGRYTLVQPLDRGGMGTVWEARDGSGSTLAIKFLTYAVAHPAALRRFRREAKALERLDHPNVVRIVAHGLEDNVPFIAMERLRGQTLRRLLQGGALPPQRALAILRGAAGGLDAAHALGIVHRDVKPSNLFLCGDHDVVTKVIDFGIATGDPFETDSQASTTGMIGSPAYMSPEQARGEQLDHSADVWSLAVVAFQMLTGREPFGGANIPETLQRICSGRPPRASQMATGLPIGIDEVFQRAFAPKRPQRFEDLRDLMRALEDLYRSSANVAATSLRPTKPAARADTTASFAGALAGEQESPLPRRWRYAAVTLAIGATVSLWIFFEHRSEPAAPASRPDFEIKLQSALAAPSATPSVPPQTVVPEVGKASAAAPVNSPSTSTTATPKAATRPLARSASTPTLAKPEVPAAPPQSAASAIASELDPVFGLRVSRPDGRTEGLATSTDTRVVDVPQ